jgi:hypothetical protein
LAGLLPAHSCPWSSYLMPQRNFPIPVIQNEF